MRRRTLEKRRAERHKKKTYKVFLQPPGIKKSYWYPYFGRIRRRAWVIKGCDAHDVVKKWINKQPHGKDMRAPLTYTPMRPPKKRSGRYIKVYDLNLDIKYTLVVVDLS